MKKKALILSPCTGVHKDITELMWNAKTTTASDKLQILPLMRCLKKNDYDIQVISYNAKYTCNEIENIEQPEICFIGKMNCFTKAKQMTQMRTHKWINQINLKLITQEEKL